MAPSAAASSPLMGSFGGEGSAGASTPRLTSENVSALLGLLPTAEELELIQGHCEATSTPASSLGRVEQFFLALGEIKHLEQRLRSMQATQGFGEQWSRLTAHVGSLREACKQVRHSAKLKHVLFLVLQIGNYLNGASTPWRRLRLQAMRPREAQAGALGRSADDPAALPCEAADGWQRLVDQGPQGEAVARRVCSAGS